MLRLTLGAAALLSVSAAQAQEAPDGLYMMTRMWVGSFELDAYFFDDGLVVRGPAGDVSDFDWEVARAAAPDQVGQVALDGPSMTISWFDGATTSAELQPSSDGCFHYNGGLFCPVDEFTTNQLEGTYEGGAAGNSQIGFMQTSATLVFLPDGRFSTSSVLTYVQPQFGADPNDPNAQVLSGDESFAAAGTYELGSTSLTLTYEDGTVVTDLAFPYGDDEETASPEYIYFGGVLFEKD